MDAITRVAYYFPTHSLTSFWILANLVINNQDQCQKQDKQLLTALIILFTLLVVMISFTDTYTASNGQVTREVFTVNMSFCVVSTICVGNCTSCFLRAHL